MRRFGTATLLGWTAGCAVYLGLSTMIGYAPAAALCVSAAVLTWAVVSKLSRWWLRGVRVAVGSVASVAIWFSAVVAVWSMERCDRCRSERYTIDYQVIGFTVTSDKAPIPSWRALTAEGLGVACRHQFQLVPCDSYGRSYGPPSDYGALLRISSRVFDPERPWHFYYDVSRKWYEWSSLSTDDYSPELASRLRRLSIDSPDIADQFWNRVESDRDYPWDGLIVDQLAFTAAENGELLDAIAWLEDSSPEEKRYLDQDIAENCIARVDKLRQLEVGDVFVYRIQKSLNKKGGRWVSGHSVICLPSDPALRSQSLQKLEKAYETAFGEVISITDYGQRYIDAQRFHFAM